jgi:hypothetical protein
MCHEVCVKVHVIHEFGLHVIYVMILCNMRLQKTEMGWRGLPGIVWKFRESVYHVSHATVVRKYST